MKFRSFPRINAFFNIFSSDLAVFDVSLGDYISFIIKFIFEIIVLFFEFVFDVSHDHQRITRFLLQFFNLMHVHQMLWFSLLAACCCCYVCPVMLVAFVLFCFVLFFLILRICLLFRGCFKNLRMVAIMFC